MRLGYLTIVWGWGISMWELPNNPSHMILRPGQNMWSGRPLVLWINRQIGQQLVGKKLWWFLCLADSGIFVALISIFDIFFHHLVQPSVQSGGSATNINVLFKPFLGHILTFALFALSPGSTPLWHHISLVYSLWSGGGLAENTNVLFKPHGHISTAAPLVKCQDIRDDGKFDLKAHIYVKCRPGHKHQRTV